MGDCSQIVFRIVTKAVSWVSLSATFHFPVFSCFPLTFYSSVKSCSRISLMREETRFSISWVKSSAASTLEAWAVMSLTSLPVLMVFEDSVGQLGVESDMT